MKADPCANLLGCGWLGWRRDDQSPPACCPKCLGPLLRADPRTGRFASAPTGLTALRAAEAARVLGEQGEAS